MTLAVGTLPIPMIEPTLQTLLVAPVGRPVLPAPRLVAAGRTAIALSPITVGTDPEQRLASLAAANSRPENHFSMNRHPPTKAAFDNGTGSCEGGTIFHCMVAFARRLPSRTPLSFHGGVLSRLPSHHTIFRGNVWMLMMGRMTAPSAPMMLPAPLRRQKA
jgi:hypothetical protein